MTDTKHVRKSSRWIVRQIISVVWLVAVIVGSLVFSAPQDLDVAVNDVAPFDIRSTGDYTYVSEILSENARQDAIRAVQPLYTDPDGSVARQQYNRARVVLSYLRALRDDTYTPETNRYAWIWAVDELAGLPETTAHSILTLPDTSWTQVQLEFLDLLDKVMREQSIRESDLQRVKSRVGVMVSLDLAQDEAVAVTDLVASFLKPNVFYDKAATEAAKTAAGETAGLAYKTYREGEIVVREGEVIGALAYEALGQLGLITETDIALVWQPALLLASVSIFALGLFLAQLSPDVLDSRREQQIIVLLLTVFIALAWALVRPSDLLPYLFPGAALAMLIATIIGKVPAIGVTIVLSTVIGMLGQRSFPLAVMNMAGGLFAILSLPRHEQTSDLFRSGLYSGLAQGIILLAFNIPDVQTDLLAVLMRVGVTVVGGLISGGLTVGLLFILTPLFDLTTTFRLIELSRPNHPLLQQLLREAPATFSHVMMVTNLAEQAAEVIGANTLLTRVGSYYHDIGKMLRPYFYSENQQGMSNPHDRLDPYTSVEVLSAHVRDGLTLAKEYHLPEKVRAFIAEHHGTMRVSFFYNKAVEAAGGEADLVNEKAFRYPGPKPQSRETLLLMLADSCEAASRARQPKTPEELHKIVDGIFRARLDEGQLDECPITMEELNLVRQTYVELLHGAYHPRVKYPEPKKVLAEPEPDIQVTKMAPVPTPVLAPVETVPDTTEQKDQDDPMTRVVTLSAVPEADAGDRMETDANPIPDPDMQAGGAIEETDED